MPRGISNPGVNLCLWVRLGGSGIGCGLKDEGLYVSLGSETRSGRHSRSHRRLPLAPLQGNRRLLPGDSIEGL